VSYTPVIIVSVYLFILGLLAVYGLHRLVLIGRYYRYKSNPPTPKQVFDRLPPVTVQLPVYNEKEVVRRLVEQVVQLDYPNDLLEIQVLDDSTDETTSICEKVVGAYQAQGVNIHHITRSHRQGFKAGALAHGLECAQGEFVAIFDADFLPNPDFLKRAMHFFTDTQVGVVQLRWGYLNRTESLLTRGQAVLLDGHFVIEHTARDRSGCFFNFNGTAGIWRKSTIAEAGGWQGDTLTEDLDLSYRAQLSGAKFVYLLDDEVPSELPGEVDAFKSQQHRWTKGAIQVLRKLHRQIWTSPLPRRVKVEAFFHFTAHFCYPLLLFAGVTVASDDCCPRIVFSSVCACD